MLNKKKSVFLEHFAPSRTNTPDQKQITIKLYSKKRKETTKMYVCKENHTYSTRITSVRYLDIILYDKHREASNENGNKVSNEMLLYFLKITLNIK